MLGIEKRKLKNDWQNVRRRLGNGYDEENRVRKIKKERK
jgi:hypothetical protein